MKITGTKNVHNLALLLTFMDLGACRYPSLAARW